MRSLWTSIVCGAALFATLSASLADKAEVSPEETLKVLAKEASACTRQANDYRVLGLNALKNADAVRAQTHKKLLEAMLSGDRAGIDTAKDGLSNATEDLEDVIEDVEKIIDCSLKAEMSAKAAEALCKIAAEKTAEPDTAKYIKDVRSRLSAAGKDLAKSEKIARRLRSDWLEPFFASTTTTSSTTTVTDLRAGTPGK